MEDWVAIVISLVAAGMAGAALWLSLRQHKQANEHHDVEWEATWLMSRLWLKNNGTVDAHDAQVVVDYGENSREVRKASVVPPGDGFEMRVKDFSTHRKIHEKAGGKDFQEDARIRIAWRTKHGTPKSQDLVMTLD